MTLMCIDRSQSPTHKGSFLQGRKSPSSGQGKQQRRRSCASPPPLLSSAKQQQQGSSRYKTELCRPFEESGSCKYGDKCQFAHGARELRSMARHPKYKTELCRTFHSTGLCPYGPRCHFIHNGGGGKETSRLLLPLGALPRSALGSAGEASPPSSHGGTPTATRSFDDLYYLDAALSGQGPQQGRLCGDAFDSASVFSDDSLQQSPVVLDLFCDPFFRLPVFDLLHK